MDLKSMYDVDDIRITLKEGSEYEAVELARLLQIIADRSSWTSREFLMIARCMLKGEGWSPPPHLLNLERLLNANRNGPLEYAVTLKPDPHAASEAEYDHGEELARLGAAGDADAAQQFCKLFLAGVMNNYACG